MSAVVIGIVTIVIIDMGVEIVEMMVVVVLVGSLPRVVPQNIFKTMNHILSSHFAFVVGLSKIAYSEI